MNTIPKNKMVFKMKKAVGFIVGGGHLYADSVLKSIYNQADYSEKKYWHI